MLQPNDLLYVAGAVQPADKTKTNEASHDAGFLGFDFCGPRPAAITPEQLWDMNRANRDSVYFAKKQTEHAASLPKYNAQHLREAAARSDDNNRLVQGRKSPTHPKQAQLSRRISQLRLSRRRPVELDSPEAFYNAETLYTLAEQPSDKRLSTVRLMHREWSGSYRILHHTQTRPSDAPEPQSGERYSEKLTQRAVTKIFESGAYVAAAKGGFSTFLTLTFSAEQRNAIFGGESTLGREVSRFLDGIKKMYQRGWLGTDENQEPFWMDGHAEPFHYIWVAECPANEHGEPNPHVHLIMNWKVEKEYFAAWSARIENIWGHGFAHLERIRQPKAAGSYIIKAVGYAAKGENADQGLIKGNRYNIARCSRAPGWDCIASFEAHNMAAIIKECGYKLEQWKKPLERSLWRLDKQHTQTIKAKAIAKQSKQPKADIQKLSARLARIENQQKAIRDQIKARGVHATTKNRFCLSFEGEQAETKAYDFLLWAAGARGWSMLPKVEETDDYFQSVAEAKAIAQQEYRDQYHRFMEKRAYWDNVLNDPLVHSMVEPTEEEYIAHMIEREDYQKIAA
ncbi:hypothetical protein ACFFLZ_06365 [Photobacterium aphoticum]|uniref:Replication-associated protein ORF2/G2P domain-containing protein n=1 Tax=Photobacterium aphoticum TaxID=754436 RepID=A0A0J1GQC5_9GAMM|nr:hypothetical protein [Photobacterium aphoticum]KLV01988.1 hypothetical protein ABT58_06275 [Photobacterium aphoticum]PSU60234.1 hypothetical protein C9I90_01030 [Photobacterium aphoticum]GHA34259.1 hypothetical protein GCM10007086_04580 [Photobacterium aphoticum]